MVHQINSALRDDVYQKLRDLVAATKLSEYEVLNRAVTFAWTNRSTFSPGNEVVNARMLADQQVRSVAVKSSELTAPYEPGSGNAPRIDTGERQSWREKPEKK